MLAYQSIFLVLVLVFSFSLGAKLPSTIKTCKRSDPDRNACLKVAIVDAIRKLEKGNPDIKFPSADPIKIPSLTIGEGTGPVHVVQIYKNVEIYNLFSGLEIKEIESVIDDDKMELKAKVSAPALNMEADYEADGSILVVPIKGTGRCEIKMNNVKADAVLTGPVIQKDGKSYVDLQTFSFVMDAGKVQFHFNNLFNGDNTLGGEMNKLLNENWKDIFYDVKQGYEEGFSAIFKQLAQIIFSRVPYDEIFPK